MLLTFGLGQVQLIRATEEDGLYAFSHKDSRLVTTSDEHGGGIL